MRILTMALLGLLLCSPPLMAGDGYDKLFDKLDKNQDGSLDRREFTGGGAKVNREKALKLFPDMRDRGSMNDRMVKERLFDRFDKNHDGLLNRDEWRQMAPNILEIEF